MTDSEIIDYLAYRFAKCNGIGIEQHMIGACAVKAAEETGKFPDSFNEWVALYRESIKKCVEEMARREKA